MSLRKLSKAARFKIQEWYTCWEQFVVQYFAAERKVCTTQAGQFILLLPAFQSRPQRQAIWSDWISRWRDFFVLSAISSRLVMLKNVDVLCEIHGCYFYEHLFLLVVFHITRIRIRMQFGYLSKHSKIITSRSSSVASDCLVSNMNGSLQKSRDNVQRWRFNLHLPDPWPKQSPLTDALICCSLSQCERQTTEHCSKSSVLIRAIIRRLIPKNRPYWHRCMVHFFGGWFEKLRPHPFLTPGLAFSTSWRTCRCAFYRLKPHRTIFYHFSKKWLCHRLQHVNALGHPRRDVTRGICQIYLLDFEAPWVKQARLVRQERLGKNPCWLSGSAGRHARRRSSYTTFSKILEPIVKSETGR